MGGGDLDAACNDVEQLLSITTRRPISCSRRVSCLALSGRRSGPAVVCSKGLPRQKAEAKSVGVGCGHT